MIFRSNCFLIVLWFAWCGVLLDAYSIIRILKKYLESLYFVDATTSFGAIPIKMSNIDFMIGNACKSLQGVPGVAFVIAKRESLERFVMSANCKQQLVVLTSKFFKVFLTNFS